MEYLKLYHLEPHLFQTVSSAFHRHGFLTAFDFFLIVIWKSNRSKSKIASRLLSKGYEDLDEAVRALTEELHSAHDGESRFRLLIEEWGLRIPMATAILTVLYPDEFTVYDVRVCDAVGDFHRLANLSHPDRIWEGYREFVAAVSSAAPAELSLRDKDRYLWGRDFAAQLESDVRRGFARSGTL